MSRLYQKVFTRDFTLPWLEIWYRGEAKTPKPWNNEQNKSFPYIVYIHHDGTVTSYYDMQGLAWSHNSVLAQIKKDGNLVYKIQSQYLENLNIINGFINKKIISDRNELLTFLDLFQNAYPWFLACWEVGESDPEQIEGLEVSSLLELKESTATLCDDVDNLIRLSLQKIFPLFAENSQVLTTAELRSGKFPSLSELKKRNAGFIYTDEKLFPSGDLKKVENKYAIKLEISEIDKDIKSLSGFSASPGFAKGLVRKLFSLSQIGDFKTGEILVSPMTMPDFVPAIQKATAIITDEGGITCHAAIVAREFNIPCVVGTKIATDVLNNGDNVEVDATRGIVTILSRSK
jgi:phosphohistidine swiveling domain-containing protein